MILEYQTHNTLNPKLWDGESLRPKLHAKLLYIAEQFTKFLEVDVPASDIILIGSNANYNWSGQSDIDLHVVINYKKINHDIPLVTKFMLAKKHAWNNKYPIKYQGIPIELFAQDSNESLNASVGVFSLIKNKWLNKPDPRQISIDDTVIEQKAAPFIYDINLIKETDPGVTAKIKDILLKLQKLRKAGLGNQGEYSIENLAYKFIRNKGYIDHLKSMYDRLTHKQMMSESTSINSALHDHVAKSTLLDTNGWMQIIKQYDAVIHPEGQWKFPGQCTVIPTTNGSITMQNVAYPVFGTDETGHSIYMQPDQQYTFPGKIIFEIPHTAQYQTLIMQLNNILTNGARYGI